MLDPHGAIRAHLAASGVPYTEHEHEAVHTSDDASRVRGISTDAGAKSLLLKTREGGFVVAVLPGSARLDMAKLAVFVGTKKLHMAAHTEVEEVMGCTIGACYPIGVVAGLRTIVDPSLFSEEQVEFNPGSHTHSIRMTPADLVAVAHAEVADVRVT